MIVLIRRFPIILSIPTLFLLWIVAVDYGWVGKSLLAGPSEIWGIFTQAFHPETHSAAIFAHAGETIARAGLGWSLALVLGGTLGLILGLNTPIYRAVEALFEFARAVPPVMLFPLLLVAFNFGNPAYIWTIAIGGIPIMVLTVARGIHSLDYSRQELLAVHGSALSLRVVTSIVEILPAIFLGARLTFSISLIVAVVTEMVFSPRSGYGLGSLAKDSQISFETPTFYACMFVLGLAGYVMNASMRHIERWLSGEPRHPA